MCAGFPSCLGCRVSILTPFEDCASPIDWDVGTHGVYLSFKAPSTSVSPLSYSFCEDSALDWKANHGS